MNSQLSASRSALLLFILATLHHPQAAVCLLARASLCLPAPPHFSHFSSSASLRWLLAGKEGRIKRNSEPAATAAEEEERKTCSKLKE